MGSVIVAVCCSNRSSPAELAAQTRLALKNRQWSRAEWLLKRLALKRAATSDDIALRAELELGYGRADEAIRILAGTPESDPAAARTRLVAGQIEMSCNRARRAEALFLEALRLDPKLGLARRQLIFLYGMQARRADVNAQFRALAESDSLDFDDVLLWATTLEDKWVNDLIQPHLERYLAADPEDRLSRLALAAVLLRERRVDACDDLLRSLADSDADARVLRAQLALDRSQIDEARALVAEGPQEHLGLALLRGQFAIQSNDPATAARQFRLAVCLNPTNRRALQGLAVVLNRLGKPEAAAPIQKQTEGWRRLTSLLQQANSLEGREDNTLFAQIAQTCEILGQNALARAWYRLALGRNPLDQEVQRALHRLR
jgi:predicted Zn-dependent protease